MQPHGLSDEDNECGRLLRNFVQVNTGGNQVSQYHDLEPTECGFLGFSFLCPETEVEQLLKRFHSHNIEVNYVEDEVYGQRVMLLRDPQNVPIRIAVTC